jgi:hypothetical protein
MIGLLRSVENEGFQQCGIRKAIKQNKIYKNYRWDFVEKNQDPNISKIKETVYCEKRPINPILKLNKTKNEILDIFDSKNSMARNLGLTKDKATRIINKKWEYNGNYYIEFNDCPKKLIEKYNKPINKFVGHQCKKVKETNLSTKNETIYNSLNEIRLKLGYANITVKNAIKDNVILGGSMWEYVE